MEQYKLGCCRLCSSRTLLFITRRNDSRPVATGNARETVRQNWEKSRHETWHNDNHEPNVWIHFMSGVPDRSRESALAVVGSAIYLQWISLSCLDGHHSEMNRLNLCHPCSWNNENEKDFKENSEQNDWLGNMESSRIICDAILGSASLYSSWVITKRGNVAREARIDQPVQTAYLQYIWDWPFIIDRIDWCHATFFTVINPPQSQPTAISSVSSYAEMPYGLSECGLNWESACDKTPSTW
jgi:hypothetical protein